MFALGRGTLGIVGLAAMAGAAALLFGAEPAAKNPVNKNSIVTEFREQLILTCSSAWAGWPAQRAFDGNPKTSWFTERGDAAALGKSPWIAAEFPANITVRRVTLLSNREPPWETGYTIQVGQLELLDAAGKVLFTRSDEIGGERPDLDIRPAAPIAGVRKIRFSSLRDEGNKNPYEDIALGEILVE